MGSVEEEKSTEPEKGWPLRVQPDQTSEGVSGCQKLCEELWAPSGTLTGLRALGRP